MNKQRKVVITTTYNEMGIIIDTKAEEVAQPNLQQTCNQLATDCIGRQAAIDVLDSETVSTNPDHFQSSEKFIKFMDDAAIASFGKWQWANGFNTALTATKVQLKKLPSAQPKRHKGKWNTYYHSDIEFSHSCNQCGYSAPYQMIGGKVFQKKWNFCPNCGAKMEGEG